MSASAMRRFFILHKICTKADMTLSNDILKKLQRKFEPSSTTPFRYRSVDIVVQSDEQGNAIRIFVGKVNDKGVIKGDRYSRILKKDKEGNTIKDHWERKGKAS